MALGYKSEEFLLKEWLVEIGVWNSPQLIGTNSTDPSTFFTGSVLGYLKQGSQNLDLAKEYAEFRAFTPGQSIRYDLVYKTMMFSGELGQFDSDSISLLKNLNSQLDYPVTIPAVQQWQIMHIGSDEPVQSKTGIKLSTTLTNGNTMIIGMYAALFVPEGDAITPSGTEHAIQQVSCRAFVHPSFAGVTNEAQKHYGFIGIKTA